MNFGRVRANTTGASPMRLTVSRSGTATSARCIPMRVFPMSMACPRADMLHGHRIAEPAVSRRGEGAARLGLRDGVDRLEPV